MEIVGQAYVYASVEQLPIGREWIKQGCVSEEWLKAYANGRTICPNHIGQAFRFRIPVDIHDLSPLGVRGAPQFYAKVQRKRLAVVHQRKQTKLNRVKQRAIPRRDSPYLF